MVVNAIPWPGEQLPTEAAIQHILHSEGLQAHRWSSGPGEVYAAHAHEHHKVLYVVSGSITFGVPEEGQHIALSAGDRFEVPAGIRHDAVVGAEGVVCMEAYRM
jgi:quercetin dioxygenase-like cupin family protein